MIYEGLIALQSYQSRHREPDTRAAKRQHRGQLHPEGRRLDTGRRQAHLEAGWAQQLEGAAQGRKSRQEWKGPLGQALLAVAGHGQTTLLLLLCYPYPHSYLSVFIDRSPKYYRHPVKM